MSYSNKYKCPSKLWRKFGWVGRAVYNEVCANMRWELRNLKRSKKSYAPASLIPGADWLVLIHNSAYYAAWAAKAAAERIAA